MCCLNQPYLCSSYTTINIGMNFNYYCVYLVQSRIFLSHSISPEKVCNSNVILNQHKSFFRRVYNITLLLKLYMYATGTLSTFTAIVGIINYWTMTTVWRCLRKFFYVSWILSRGESVYKPNRTTFCTGPDRASTITPTEIKYKTEMTDKRFGTEQLMSIENLLRVKWPAYSYITHTSIIRNYNQRKVCCQFDLQANCQFDKKR